MVNGIDYTISQQGKKIRELKATIKGYRSVMSEIATDLGLPDDADLVAILVALRKLKGGE